jgi:hypothetical protein
VRKVGTQEICGIFSWVLYQMPMQNSREFFTVFVSPLTIWMNEDEGGFEEEWELWEKNEQLEDEMKMQTSNISV